MRRRAAVLRQLPDPDARGHVGRHLCLGRRGRTSATRYATAYDVEASSKLGGRSVTVDQNPESVHRIVVRTELGAVTVAPLT